MIGRVTGNTTTPVVQDHSVQWLAGFCASRSSTLNNRSAPSRPGCQKGAPWAAGLDIVRRAEAMQTAQCRSLAGIRQVASPSSPMLEICCRIVSPPCCSQDQSRRRRSSEGGRRDGSNRSNSHKSGDGRLACRCKLDHALAIACRSDALMSYIPGDRQLWQEQQTAGAPRLVEEPR